jgi:hypothetical protein
LAYKPATIRFSYVVLEIGVQDDHDDVKDDELDEDIGVEEEAAIQ